MENAFCIQLCAVVFPAHGPPVITIFVISIFPPMLRQFISFNALDLSIPKVSEFYKHRRIFNTFPRAAGDAAL